MAGRSDESKFLFDTLFIAVPELGFDKRFLGALLREFVFDTEDETAQVKALLSNAERVKKVRARLRNKTLMERLVLVVPEVISTSTVGFLRTFGLIDSPTATKYRLIANIYTGATKPVPPDRNQILTRLHRVGGAALSNDAIDLLRYRDEADLERARAAFKARNKFDPFRDDYLEILQANDSVRGAAKRKEIREEAKYLRARREESMRKAEARRIALLAVGPAGRLVAAIRGGDTLLQSIYFAAPELVSPAMMALGVRTGLITPAQAAIMGDLLDYAPSAWRAIQGARAADGIAARLLIGMYGAVNQELLDALAATGVITPRQRRILQPIVAQARRFALARVEAIPGKQRRYRVLPGETPLQTFARTSRDTDREILRLLAQAASDASKRAAELEALGGRGRAVRAAQYRVTAAELHMQMRILYEGIGHLTIRGEQEAARAAVEAMSHLERGLFKGRGLKNAQESLRASARAGVDGYISRKENLLPLSRRLYGNREVLIGTIDKQINLGLLRGTSAAELSKQLQRFLSPSVPGGASYVAMRLARTEINNAFHFTSIRYEREKPWVQGFKWHLSGSHGRPDICNTYAETDHHDRGKGIFPKNAVPGKPHPHCLCYITPELMSEDQFLRSYKAGNFKRYFDAQRRAGIYDVEAP